MKSGDKMSEKLIFENEIIGLSDAIDERFHNNLAYYLNNCCPVCGTVLDKKIKGTQQCSECKKSIVFKQNIHNDNCFLITFDDLKEFNKLEEELSEIYLYEEQMEELNKRYPDYMYYFWNLKKKNPNLSNRDYAWGFENWLLNTLDVKYVNDYKQNLNLNGNKKIEACDHDVEELQKASLIHKYMMDIAIYNEHDDPAEELLLSLMYRNIELAHLYYLHCEERHVSELKFFGDILFCMEYVLDYLNVYQYSLEDLKEKFFRRARKFLLNVVSKEDAWSTFCEAYDWYLKHKNNDTNEEKNKLVPNPDFAEVLMSTFYAGGDMTESEYEQCKQIWIDHNNDRSEVLKIVVELCGDINTSQTRYLKAISWSFNKVEYAEQRIQSITNYLDNKLYKKAYENSASSINKGINYGKKVHIMTMLQYLADAYCHLKDYEKEEDTYLQMYDLNIITPNCCVKLAKYYAKRGQKEKAIDILKKEKKKLLYIFKKEYREPIDKYLKELEKKEQGISKHVFVGYDTYQSAFIGDKYHPELEKKGMSLREKYKKYFDYHREFLESIDMCEYKMKNCAENIDEIKEEYNTSCLSDINIYPKIMEYYNELNSLGFGYRIEYQDNSSKDYPVFRKLISFYEKEGKIEDAIKLCDIAIDYGITKYLGSTSMSDKKEKLMKKQK